jgi:hypothetical protein
VIGTFDDIITDDVRCFFFKLQEIRNRERQLIEELHNMYGPDCMECIEGRKELCHRVETLRSTCTLTEVILNGKDIELLLLKKDVQDKLEALAGIESKPTPGTCNKVRLFDVFAVRN